MGVWSFLQQTVGSQLSNFKTPDECVAWSVVLRSRKCCRCWLDAKSMTAEVPPPRSHSSHLGKLHLNDGWGPEDRVPGGAKAGTPPSVLQEGLTRLASPCCWTASGSGISGIAAKTDFNPFDHTVHHHLAQAAPHRRGRRCSSARPASNPGEARGDACHCGCYGSSVLCGNHGSMS